MGGPDQDSEQYDLAIPGAGALVESLRSVGYSLETAIADIIDNSITAGAKTVELHFHWDGAASRVTVLDDGKGMGDQELVEAMRPGSRSPLDERTHSDLGRFGLGLKTASFSQCRQLTVASRRLGDSIAIRRWDLDYVGRTREWRLLKTATPGATAELSKLEGRRSGTLVVWEQLDRVVPAHSSAADRLVHDRFLDRTKRVETHLGMVFHRFLEPPRGLKILINGGSVVPWDPFVPEHPARRALPSRTLLSLSPSVPHVRAQGFVLPHKDRFASLADFDRAGGPNGWTSQQGFYVYRNERLLVAGGWLDIGLPSDEQHKLARILIELPNTLDAVWDIDVKKSRARPPLHQRGEMRVIAEAVRAEARSVFVHRGQFGRMVGGRATSVERPWRVEAGRNGKRNRYRIEREHPLVRLVREQVKDLEAFNSMLHLLEETVPVEQIWLDVVEHPGGRPAPFEEPASPELVDILKRLYEAFRKRGATSDEARRHVLLMEPFNHHPELVASLEDD